MSDDDPFDRLGPDEEREGDPFDRLGPVDDTDGNDVADENDVATDTDETDAASDAIAAAEADPAETVTADESPDSDPWGPPGEDRRNVSTDENWSEANADEGRPSTPDDGGDPFAGVTTPEESPFDAGGASAFERVDVGGTDPDQVWESITSEDDEDEPTPMPEEGRYKEVSKHTYCEGCEFFSSPPDVTCTHESAEIIEFVDVETVRLLNCPVVAEREALERRE